MSQYPVHHYLQYCKLALGRARAHGLIQGNGGAFRPSIESTSFLGLCQVLPPPAATGTDRGTVRLGDTVRLTLMRAKERAEQPGKPYVRLARRRWWRPQFVAALGRRARAHTLGNDPG
jgi:hypothetical protein